MLETLYAFFEWLVQADPEEPIAELNAGLVIDYDG